MRRWTDAEVRASGAGEQADIFRFAALPACWEHVPDFFLGAHWYGLGDEVPMPLIEGVASLPTK